MSWTTAVTGLALVGAAQGLVLAAAFLSLGRRERGDRLLALLLAGGATAVALVQLSHEADLAPLHFGLELAEYTLWFFVGPVFYLYIHRITGGRTRSIVLLHLLPGLVWLLYLTAWRLDLADFEFPGVLGMIGYQLLYTALSAQRLADLWSAELPPVLHRFWSRAWLAVLVALHVAQLARYLLRQRPAFDGVVPLTGAIAFFTLTFLGIRNSRLLTPRSRGRRGSRPPLPAERSEAIAAKVREALAHERRFLDSGLTLASLASDLRVPRAQLSQAINEGLGQSFLELVNGYRVREAQRLLDDPDTRQLTIEAIVFRSGFASRSTFYEAFRRETGTTPTRYRDSRPAGGS